MDEGLIRRVSAEAIGTALLLAAVVGSGVMAERLSGGNDGLTLLANSLATGGVLYALIASLGPISGAHFNPVVSLVMAGRGDLPWKFVAPYMAAQLVGAVCGVMLAHGMFDLPAMTLGTKVRTGPSQWLAEAVATFGLVLTIWLTSRRSAPQVPAAVAGYIAGAYWFTASTSFANPAVTVARSLTDTFACIRPEDIPGFAGAQLVGAIVAWGVLRRLDHESARPSQ
jgi:glycerol uptake facilitator-like aquaporin